MKLAKKTLIDVNVKGKKVLVRADFNVPLDKKTGAITDDRRIKAALPTIEHLLEQGAAVILISHLGRPKSGPEAKFSLAPVATRLGELISAKVTLATDVIGEDAQAKAAVLQAGEVLILENVRFHKEETKNVPAFAKALASLGDYYVNDAFGTAHRAHASTAGLANYLPSCAGKLIEREISVLNGALEEPKRPLVAILGGAKVSDKIGVIENLLDKVDTLIIGGGMAYTFYAAKGLEVGSSLCERDKVELAKELLAKAELKGVKLLLPEDNIVADAFANDANTLTVAEDAMPEGYMGLDIGPKAIATYSAEVQKAGTVIWNGPMGVFELANFAAGTKALAAAIADSKAMSIIGGGDSAAAVEQLGYASAISHISTGGGASLEFLEGKTLPGIDALADKNARRTLAAGNWKMNQGLPAEATKFIASLLEATKDAPNRMMVAVPATALDAALKVAEYTPIKVAAQNAHPADKGAFTGEISMQMLANMGVHAVLVGHSERRDIFGETDSFINEKVHAARNNGLRVVFCCGESLETREKGETFAWVLRQLQTGLAGVSAEQMAFVTVAYEPIWAIGTGKTASNEQAEEVCAFIRESLATMYNKELADNTTILYGGSVNGELAPGLFAMPNIDGGLVGGASLKVADFANICKA